MRLLWWPLLRHLWLRRRPARLTLQRPCTAAANPLGSWRPTGSTTKRSRGLVLCRWSGVAPQAGLHVLDPLEQHLQTVEEPLQPGQLPPLFSPGMRSAAEQLGRVDAVYPIGLQGAGAGLQLHQCVPRLARRDEPVAELPHHLLSLDLEALQLCIAPVEGIHGLLAGGGEPLRHRSGRGRVQQRPQGPRAARCKAARCIAAAAGSEAAARCEAPSAAKAASSGETAVPSEAATTSEAAGPSEAARARKAAGASEAAGKAARAGMTALRGEAPVAGEAASHTGAARHRKPARGGKATRSREAHGCREATVGTAWLLDRPLPERVGRVH
mmetsp:Transcript_57726/g.185525  ORF Transcript_57726/g.185525 Transcript_57726/m.185525 type:complete len:327 (+) Transcript_57726:715-1695(+)